MNQKDIVNIISKKMFVTKTETNETLNKLLDLAADELKQGKRIYLRNFGSLTAVKRKPKKVRSINSKKIITIPERTTIEFTPSKTLLNKINP